MNRLPGLILLSGLLLAGAAGAETTLGIEPEPSFRLQGFGTLGLARSDDHTVEYVRDYSQPGGLAQGWSSKIDSMFGVQANYAISSQNEAVLQVVSRYHHDGSYDPEVTWAFLRHEVSPEFNWRLGRLGTELFMLADSRLVGYSNLTVRPPPDYYGVLVFSYIDGADLNLTTPLAGGLLRSKLYAGISPEKTPFGPFDWDLRGTSLVGGHLDFIRGPWQVRLGHTLVKFDKETPLNEWLAADPAYPYPLPYNDLVPEMAMAGTHAHFSSFGLVYDEGALQLQFMLNRVDYESPAYEDAKAGYVIAAYKLGSVTPYLGYSRAVTSAGPLPSKPLILGLDTLTARLVSESHNDQHTVFLGARWDVYRNVALKAQVDWVNGKPESLFTYRNSKRDDWDGSMTVWSLALDFVF